MSFFALDVVLLVLLEAMEFLEMLQRNISYSTNRFRACWGKHHVEIVEKGLIDGYKIVNVAKQDFGFIWRYDCGILAPGKVSQRVSIVLLEYIKAIDVGTFACDEFVDD